MSSTGKKPYLCHFSEEDTPAAALRPNHRSNNITGKNAGDSRSELPAVVSTSENKIKAPFPKYVDCKIAPDLKRPTFQTRGDFPCSSRTVDFVSSTGQTCSDTRLDLPTSWEIQGKYAEENSDTYDYSTLHKGTDIQEKGPLDLSEKSSRADSCNTKFTSTLQAGLIVHLCPYCSHKTYYPEVLWMHKRIWHKVSCNSVAPPWVVQNGFKSVKHNSVFMTTSGRTGPPPALGGKECQPLPIARFTRTQVPSGLSGSKSSPSGLVVTAKPGTMPKDALSTSNFGPRSSGTDGYRQPKLNHAHEKYSMVTQQAQLKAKCDVNPKLTQAGSFTRSSTPFQTVISKPSSQPSNSKQTEKYIFPQISAGFAPLSTHSALELGKTSFFTPPPYHPSCKTEPYVTQEDPSQLQQEPNPKRENDVRAPTNCTAGARVIPLTHTPPSVAGPPPIVPPSKQEPSSEGHEKRLDILNIFKTSIPKELATLYQSWGANSPAVDQAGKNPKDFLF